MASLAALGASLSLALMLFASRLPPGPDFFLPRRGGYGVYQAAWALLGTMMGRRLFSWGILLMLLSSAVALIVSLRLDAKRLPKAWSARIGPFLGPLFAAYLSCRAVSHYLDYHQGSLFPYGKMNPWELPWSFVSFAVILLISVFSARSWITGRRRRALGSMAALIALDVTFAVLSYTRPLPPVGPGHTLYVVLTETDKGPSRDLYSLPPDVFADNKLKTLKPDPTLPELRALYEQETKRWDAAGLRDALLLGLSKGDPAAPSLLLSHLTAVPPSSVSVAVLGVLSDETSYRIGPLGAAALARAYAHVGDLASAKRWAARADGPNGIAPGLLGLNNGITGKPGTISGSVRAPGPLRVALYVRPDPAAPYLLDAAGFVASAAPDARGRFAFTGLPAGRYSLAFAFPDQDRGEVSVSGHRGDLILDARRPALELPPVTVSFTPR